MWLRMPEKCCLMKSKILIKIQSSKQFSIKRLNIQTLSSVFKTLFERYECKVAMNAKLIPLLLGIQLMFGLPTVLGKFHMLADGLIERCDTKKSQDRVADLQIEFLVEEDELYFNGNCTINADIEAWTARFWTDKKAGSVWFRAPFQRSNIDVCGGVVDTKSFLNPYFKDQKPCPLKKGVSSQHCIDQVFNNYWFFQDVWVLDMVRMNFDDLKTTKSLDGEYILFVEFQYKVNGVDETDCVKKRGEIAHFWKNWRIFE